MHAITRIALGGWLALGAALTAQAASYELQVYGDEISARGEVEAETVLSVARPRSGTGLTGHVEQLLAEVNYGIAMNWEVGLELPAVRSDQHRGLEGLAIEAQYAAPHDKAGGWYWGVRADIGRVASVYEDDTALTLEVDPIVGYRDAGIRMSFNPSLERALGGDEHAVRLQPAAKLALRASERDEWGVEYFGDWGHVHRLLPSDQRDETLFVAWDRRTSFGRLNMGLGQALHPAGGSSDRWVAKVAIQFETD